MTNETQVDPGAPRVPKIAKDLLDAANFIDACVAKAPLTRAESQGYQESIARILIRLEQAEESKEPDPNNMVPPEELIKKAIVRNSKA